MLFLLKWVIFFKYFVVQTVPGGTALQTVAHKLYHCALRLLIRMALLMDAGICRITAISVKIMLHL